MEVWNGIWKKIFVWNEYGMEDFLRGMEENFQYGISKNHLLFHSIACQSLMQYRWSM